MISSLVSWSSPFIATGGGSAKTGFPARVGLVAGNLAKRFCAAGEPARTALIVLTLYADNAEVMRDPDRAWGIASRRLLTSGLRGLMLACLLAALMSSADTYMLRVRPSSFNLYLPYIRPGASEAACLRMGRLCGMIVIVGAARGVTENDECLSTASTDMDCAGHFCGPILGGSLLATSYHNRILGDDRFYSRLLLCGPRHDSRGVAIPSGVEFLTIVTDQVTTRVQREATPKRCSSTPQCKFGNTNAPERQPVKAGAQASEIMEQHPSPWLWEPLSLICW